MTNKEKKVIITIIAIMVAILVIIMVVKKGGNVDTPISETQEEKDAEEKYITKLEDGTKLNNSEEFNNTKKYKDLEFSNIQFTSKNGNSVLLATVTNTSNKKHAKEVVKITIIGENGKVIAEPTAMISEMEAGASRKLNLIVTADIANAKDFKVGAE